jgi:hypothetical protein
MARDLLAIVTKAVDDLDAAKAGFFAPRKRPEQSLPTLETTNAAPGRRSTKPSSVRQPPG